METGPDIVNGSEAEYSLPQPPYYYALPRLDTFSEQG